MAGAASLGRRPFSPGWWYQPGPIGIHASAFQGLGYLFLFERGGWGVNLGVSYIVLASYLIERSVLSYLRAWSMHRTIRIERTRHAS